MQAVLQETFEDKKAHLPDLAMPAAQANKMETQTDHNKNYI